MNSIAILVVLPDHFNGAELFPMRLNGWAKLNLSEGAVVAYWRRWDCAAGDYDSVIA